MHLTEVEIARPATKVFAVLANVENTSRWYPAEVTEYWTSDGPVGVGSTRRAEGRAYGIRTVNDAEVTVFEPHRALALRSLTGPVPFHTTILLSTTGDGTRVTWTTELKPTGIYRWVVALTAPLHHRQTRLGLDNLKRLMESGAL